MGINTNSFAWASTVFLLQTTTSQTTNTGVQNPCTTANVNSGKIYFSVATDSHQFIECDLNGNANVLTCPSQLLWDENRLSCVYQFQTGVMVTTPNPNGGLGGKFDYKMAKWPAFYRYLLVWVSNHLIIFHNHVIIWKIRASFLMHVV